MAAGLAGVLAAFIQLEMHIRLDPLTNKSEVAGKQHDAE